MNWQGSKPCSRRIGSGLPGPVRFAVLGELKPLSLQRVPFFAWGCFRDFVCASFGTRFSVGTFAAPANYRPRTRRPKHMLVERGLRVMNAEVVGHAYAIASNYLRRSGAIPDTFATDERLLEIIVQMFQRGEFNKIRLANKAIVKFEAETYIA